MKKFHDKAYKKFFSIPAVVEAFLRSFVHQKFIKDLDFSTLQRFDKSFVTNDFKEKESDIIYKINFQGHPVYIYLLIEFQSTVDYFMPVRILRYILELYDSLRLGGHDEKLPAIFPIMLYNGDKEWDAENRIQDLIEHSIPEKFIPRFEYLPVLIKGISKRILSKVKSVISAVFYVENSSIEEIQAEIDTIVDILREEEPELVKIFVRWFNIAFERKGKKVDKLIEKIENMMEVKNMLETSVKQYEEKIIEKTASRMLSENIPEDVIIRCTGFDHKHIEKLRRKIKKQ